MIYSTQYRKERKAPTLDTAPIVFPRNKWIICNELNVASPQFPVEFLAFQVSVMRGRASAKWIGNENEIEWIELMLE